MQRNTAYPIFLILAFWLGLCYCAPVVQAQATFKADENSLETDKKDPLPAVPGGWVEARYASSQDRTIHLCNPQHHITQFPWTPGKDIFQGIGEPPYASYKFDKATDTETFQLYGNRSNRAEIRLHNEYEFGATQFEGYVTFYAPTNDECLMQIWGSDEGATQLMVRAFGDNNGCIGINFKNSGTPKFLHDLYGKETKVNVFHFQEDLGNKIMVYLNDHKVIEFPDNEKAINHGNQNYHKWGCYGTVKPGHESPKVVWRHVRHFVAGAAAPGAKQPTVKAADQDTTKAGEQAKAASPKKAKGKKKKRKAPSPDQARTAGDANAAPAKTENAAPAQTVAASADNKIPKSIRESIMPAVKNGGFLNEGYVLWCPSVIKVGDTYHMFCSRWPGQYEMGGWTEYSECVHATSKELCGPYEFKEVVLQKRPDHWDNHRVHNIKIIKTGDTYVIYYINTANATGFACSKSIDGPWTRLDKPAMSVSNPAVLPRPDGSIYVFGRLGVNHHNRAIVFEAANFMGPYKLQRNGENVLPDPDFDLEDPCIWWANNQYNVLLNDFGGKATGTKKGGAQYFSKDGLHYTLVSKEPVFTKKVDYNDGTTEIVNRRERPFVYANEKGEALALFTACYYKTPNGKMSAKIVANPIDHYVPNN